MRALCLLALSVWTATGALAVLLADEWEPPVRRDYYSPRKRFMLRVTPHRALSLRPGHCRAELYEILDSRHRPVWSRHLINNAAPVRVAIPDSGKYVVTMNEWYEDGMSPMLPIVVYGERGALISVHSTDSLGIDMLHVEKNDLWGWDQGSMHVFDEQGEFLFLRLRWGQVFAVRLEDGEVLSPESLSHAEWDSLFLRAKRGFAEIARQLRE